MPRDNGPPRYFIGAVEMVISGLPSLQQQFDEAGRARKEKLEPVIQALSTLYSLLGDFFDDLKLGRETEDKETQNIA